MSVQNSLAIAACLPNGSPAVAPPGRVEVERAAGLDLGGHVGEQERQALEVDDRPAELLALLGVGDGVVERGLGQADRAGGDAEPAAVERGQRDLEALALLAEQPVGADPGAVEAHLGGGRAR